MAQLQAYSNMIVHLSWKTGQGENSSENYSRGPWQLWRCCKDAQIKLENIICMILFLKKIYMQNAVWRKKLTLHGPLYPQWKMVVLAWWYRKAFLLQPKRSWKEWIWRWMQLNTQQFCMHVFNVTVKWLTQSHRTIFGKYWKLMFRWTVFDLAKPQLFCKEWAKRVRHWLLQSEYTA